MQTVSVDFTGSGKAGYDLVGRDRCPDLIRIIVDFLALVDDFRILKRTTLCICRIPAVTRPFLNIVEDCLLGQFYPSGNSLNRVTLLASRVVISEMAMAPLPTATPKDQPRLGCDSAITNGLIVCIRDVRLLRRRVPFATRRLRRSRSIRFPIVCLSRHIVKLHLSASSQDTERNIIIGATVI